MRFIKKFTLATLMTLGVVAQLAGPVSAAEYSTSPPPSGGGSQTVGGPPVGGGGGGGATVACYAPDGTGRATTSGVATASDPVLYDWYPGCAGYGWTGEWEQCPTSFEVWRFYGTVENPTLALTASKVNNAPGSCDQFEAFISENHPDDGYGQVVAGSVPWRSSGLRSGPSGVPYNYSQLRSLRPVYTPTPAFNMAGRFCSDYERLNVELGRYFDDTKPEFSSSEADSIRRSYFDTLAALVAETPAQPGYANVRMDLAYLPGGRVAIGDQYNCASPRDFTSVIAPNEDPLRAPQRNVSGYCYSATTTVMERFDSAGGGSVWVPRNANASYTAAYQVGIERYQPNDTSASDMARGNWGGQPNGIATNAGVPADVAARVSGFYRNALEAELSGRPWTLGLGSQSYKRTYTPGYGMINHYAQPALPAGGTWAVALGARCAMSYGDYVSVGTGTTTDPVGAGASAVEYLVSTPTVAQSGGKIREPYSISAKPGSILCGAVACPTTPGSAPELLSVTASVALNSPSGKVRGPDWQYTTAPKQTGLNFFAAAEFYSPTEQSAKYTVSATGTAEVAYYVPKQNNIVVCGDYASGRGCQTITNTTNERVVRTVPLNIVFTSGSPGFQVIGSLVTPTPGRQ